MHNLKSLSIVLILWFAGLCSAAQFSKVGHILLELQVLYPNADSSLGFLVSLISLVGALLGLTAGVLVARLGSRNILLAGLALGCLVSLVQSFHLPLGVFLLSRAIEGASHLAIVVAAPTLMALHSSDKMRSAAMTLWGTFFGVSFAITAWLGLPLVANHGVNALFFAHGIFMGITTLLVFWVLPKTNSHLTKPTEPFSFSLIIKRHKDSWSSPSIAAPAAGWLFYATTFAAMLAILPTLFPADDRSFVSTTLPLMSIFTSMTIGILLLRIFSAVQVLFIGFSAAIGFAMLYVFFSDVPVFALLLFASLGLVQGASFASIPQLNPSAYKQALANGAFAQAGNIGNLWGTPLLLLLVNLYGISGMIFAVIGCYVLAIAVHLFFANKRRIENAHA